MQYSVTPAVPGAGRVSATPGTPGKNQPLSNEREKLLPGLTDNDWERIEELLTNKERTISVDKKEETEKDTSPKAQQAINQIR